MSSRYAERTNVNPIKTQAEIQALLEKHGCENFAIARDPNTIVIGFMMNNRRVRFVLPMPEKDDPEFKTTPTGKSRSVGSMNEAYEQEVRRRWRALLLVIKSKLESIASGIETFDQAFMPHLLLPDGRTMSEWAGPQIEQAYMSGAMPPLLGSGS